MSPSRVQHQISIIDVTDNNITENMLFTTLANTGWKLLFLAQLMHKSNNFVSRNSWDYTVIIPRFRDWKKSEIPIWQPYF